MSAVQRTSFPLENPHSIFFLMAVDVAMNVIRKGAFAAR